MRIAAALLTLVLTAVASGCTDSPNAAATRRTSGSLANRDGRTETAERPAGDESVPSPQTSPRRTANCHRVAVGR